MPLQQSLGWQTVRCSRPSTSCIWSSRFFRAGPSWKQVKETGCDPSRAYSSGSSATKPCLGGISDEMSGTGIFIALMCIAQAGQFLGSVSRAVDTFSQARKAVKEAVDVIGRKPAIDTEDEGGSGLPLWRATWSLTRCPSPTPPGPASRFARNSVWS